MVAGIDRQPKKRGARDTLRDAHRAYVLGHAMLPVCAGGTLDSDGTHNGSVYFFEADSIERVHDWVAREPYASAGIYEAIVIREIDTSSPMWTIPGRSA
jgi:uncharacterized protein YciI